MKVRHIERKCEYGVANNGKQPLIVAANEAQVEVVGKAQ